MQGISQFQEKRPIVIPQTPNPWASVLPTLVSGVVEQVLQNKLTEGIKEKAAEMKLLEAGYERWTPPEGEANTPSVADKIKGFLGMSEENASPPMDRTPPPAGAIKLGSDYYVPGKPVVTSINVGGKEIPMVRPGTGFQFLPKDAKDNITLPQLVGGLTRDKIAAGVDPEVAIARGYELERKATAEKNGFDNVGWQNLNGVDTLMGIPKGGNELVPIPVNMGGARKPSIGPSSGGQSLPPVGNIPDRNFGLANPPGQQVQTDTTTASNPSPGVMTTPVVLRPPDKEVKDTADISIHRSALAEELKREPTAKELEQRLIEVKELAAAAQSSGKVTGLKKASDADVETMAKDLVTWNRAPYQIRNAFGDAISNRAINRAVELDPTYSPIEHEETAKGIQSELNRLYGLRGTVMSFAKTTDKNLAIVEKLSDKVDRTGVPVINRWLVAGKKSIAGDPDVAAFNGAVRTAINEYAKVTSSVSGAGVTSDTARKEIEDILNMAQTPEQTKAVVALLRSEMTNRKEGFEEQIKETTAALRTRPVRDGLPAPTSQQSTPPQQPAPGRGTTGTYKQDTPDFGTWWDAYQAAVEKKYGKKPSVQQGVDDYNARYRY